MQVGVPMAVSKEVTSVFADTGDNLCITPAAIREVERTSALVPRWAKLLRPLWVGHNHLRRLAAGHFHLKPTSYSIYTKSSPDRRAVVKVPHPTALWRNRR